MSHLNIPLFKRCSWQKRILLRLHFEKGASIPDLPLHLGNKLVVSAELNWVPMSSSAAQGDLVRSKGEQLRLQAPLDKINLHLREGSIIPSQVTGNDFNFSGKQRLSYSVCLQFVFCLALLALPC